MRRLFIVRKDLNMSAGKMSAQLAHCAEAYWLHLIAENCSKIYINRYPAITELPGKNVPRFYFHNDLYHLGKKAYEEGKKYFYAGHKDPDDPYSSIVEEEPKFKYSVQFDIDPKIYEDYINGAIVKTVCQARNLKHLLKAKDLAEEQGLVEEKDFGFIRDLCLTELTPDSGSKTCTTAFWTAPLPDEVAHAISRKYHLYVD